MAYTSSVSAKSSFPRRRESIRRWLSRSAWVPRGGAEPSAGTTGLVWLLTGWSSAAHAQLLAPERGAYVSATFGNGKIYGGNASGNTSMRDNVFEVRAGRDLNPALLGERSIDGARATARLDFAYYNEGHPDNNHRDGFALQLAWQRMLGSGMSAELAAGPYLSMNTTVLDGVQRDDAHLGMLYSAALRFPLPMLEPGTHLRLAFNHVSMRDVHRSNALLLGIGRHFVGVPPSTEAVPGRPWLGFSYGYAMTNLSGSRAANAAVLELKQYRAWWALSAKAIDEGDDGARVDRRGVAAQWWLLQPLTERWTASAGIGPYLARNRREDNRSGTNTLITFQAERSAGRDTRLLASFSRVKTFRGKNDRDLFQFGLQHAFGR